MVSNRTLGIFLLILILFLGTVLAFVADMSGVVNLTKSFPFLKPVPEKISKIHEPPDALAIEEFRKEKEKLAEEKENLIQKELELKEKEEKLQKLQDELEEKKQSLDLEKKKLASIKDDITEKKDKIKNMAGKIANMPPEDAIKIILSWSDWEIIDVFKQMDADANEAGTPSTVPYLLNLIEKSEPGRAGNITNKWMQDPKLAVEDKF